MLDKPVVHATQEMGRRDPRTEKAVEGRERSRWGQSVRARRTDRDARAKKTRRGAGHGRIHARVERKGSRRRHREGES